MSGENIQLPKPNLTGDRDNTNFYCFSNGVMLVKKRGSPYNLVSTYPVDTYVSNNVLCTQFDGYYYWSLEPQTSGFTIKKWELDSGILRQRDIFSFSDTFQQKYGAYSFAVDSYSDILVGLAGIEGSSTLYVNDVSIFDIGDEVVIGPSSSGIYTGEYEKRTVSNKTSSALILDLPLTKSFSSGDYVYTNRFFYVFNRYSPYDLSKGALLKYRSSNGLLYSFHSSHTFAEVYSSCFYEGRILFIKGHELIFVTPSNLVLYRHLAIDNLRDDRADTVPIYSIWAHSGVLYRLQNIRVYWDDENDVWDEDAWSPYYHYISEAIPEITEALVYFVDLNVYPDFIHAVADGVPTTTAEVTVTVMNQDRVPLTGRYVLLSSSKGSLSPSSGITNSDGQLVSTYNGTSYIGEVEITATIT